MSSPPRVVILGGGVGAVTTAIKLSEPGWQKHYGSITLYQQGWRLGGKGACGRGTDSRIEEHGLHIWFGFYENAFRMLDRCHRELDELAAAKGGPPRWPLPFKSVEESFHPSSEISLTDHDGCCWKLWSADFFDDSDDRPWADPDLRNPGERPEDWSVVFYLGRCLRLAADLACSLVDSDPGLKIAQAPAAAAREGVGGLAELSEALWDALGGDLQGLLGTAAETLDAIAFEGPAESAALELLEPLLQALDIALDLLRTYYDEAFRASDTMRRAYYVVDIMLAIARGAIADGVAESDDFSLIDDVDFQDWLMTHGAARASAECALVRSVVYDLAFAFEDGDPNRPACGAGTALHGLLRTFFTYRGALMWKMNSGMGDVIFAPLYELLVKRGVKVEFFHRAEAVRAQGGEVTEIEIDVQAVMPSTTDPDSYVPAMKTGAVSSAAWPADPGLLLAGAQTAPASATGAPAGEDYESWYADRAKTRVKTIKLSQGAKADGFEVVVFGLPISTVEHVAPDLPAQSPRWQAAVDHLKTVPTQAMQLWLDRPADQLADVEPGAVVGGYTEPYDTWADMFHLCAHENVKGAVTVAYFCNALLDSPAPPRGQADAWIAERKALARALAERFLKHDIGGLWPLAVDPLSGGLDWKILIAPAGVQGKARLDHQYLRANIEPSERYVLSVPGSSRHRIAGDDTGFTNLYAAGDWTECTINAGCVEAAVISGMVAANGIHTSFGDPAGVEPIIGRR